jgi:5'-3' exonuclease
MLKGIKAKLQARFFCHSRDAADIAISKMNDLPVTWAAELCMVDKVQLCDQKTNYTLKKQWKTIYDKEALWGVEPEKAAKRYLEALYWTFAYYKGEKIDTYWYYPWHLPPRMETIVKELESEQSIYIPTQVRPTIKPLEQLAMVLPLSSFHLLPSEYKELETLHPHAWPTKWGTYSFGRRFLWECEPLIPLIKPDQIRKWIETLYED